MAWPIVTVASGGLPVTEAGALGVPVEEAANGYGTPVTFVMSGGLPVAKIGGLSALITAPAQQTILTNGVATTLAASSPGATSGEFFQDGVSIGTATNAGSGLFTLAWTPSGINYNSALTFKANGTATSPPVTIVVAEANTITETMTSWTRTGITSATGGQNSPDGGSTATRFLMAAGTGLTARLNTSSSLTPSEFNSGFSLWAAVDGVKTLLIYPLQDGANHYAYIDLTTGQTLTSRALCKIVETKIDRGITWKRIWFQFLNAAAGPKDIYIYFCNDIGDNTPDFAGTEAIYLDKPRMANGVLPFTTYQKLSIRYVSTTSGVEKWQYTSPLIDSVADDIAAQNLYVIKPTGWIAAGSYPVLFALPALSESGEAGVPALFKTGNYADTYGCVIVIPYDKTGVPWWGQFADGTHDGHKFIAQQVSPFAEEFLAGGTGRQNKLLLGYSKAAHAAYSLLLKNPTVFGYASGWDGPWATTYANAVTNYGASFGYDTQAQWDLYNPIGILGGYLSSVSDKRRLVIHGYYTFQSDLAAMKTALDGYGIQYSYNSTLASAHAYNSGWLSGAVAALFALR